MAVKFSVCMRTHGVTEFPDPTIGANGLPNFGPTPTVDGGAPVFNAAHRACEQDLPSLAPHTSTAKAAANAAALKYATCMRSNGVPNFPDPDGQGLIQINDATGTLDESSPQFQKAQTACKPLANGFAQQSSEASSSSGAGGGS